MQKSKLIAISVIVLSLSLGIHSCDKAADTLSKKNPEITWSNPNDISYGTTLSSTQLNATADVEGTFVYTPAIGTKLNVGTNQNLKVDFTPNDITKYNTISKTVTINVTDGLIFGTMTDQEGNTYKTITIGTQTWMAENLKVTRYRNGDSIKHVPGNDWIGANFGAYCYYDNDLTNKNIHGNLYNWYAATDSRNIAPVGWHVPTTDELLTLRNFLGNEAGGKLKEIGTTHWNKPNTGATNQSGFTAVPSGFRNSCNAVFQAKGSSVFYWSSTAYDEIDAFEHYLQHDNEYFTTCYAPKTYGLSIRLIKD